MLVFRLKFCFFSAATARVLALCMLAKEKPYKAIINLANYINPYVRDSIGDQMKVNMVQIIELTEIFYCGKMEYYKPRRGTAYKNDSAALQFFGGAHL